MLRLQTTSFRVKFSYASCHAAEYHIWCLVCLSFTLLAVAIACRCGGLNAVLQYGQCIWAVTMGGSIYDELNTMWYTNDNGSAYREIFSSVSCKSPLGTITLVVVTFAPQKVLLHVLSPKLLHSTRFSVSVSVFLKFPFSIDKNC